jgi:hypothetical protein
LLFQTSRVRTQKKEVVFSDSLAEERQKAKGKRQKSFLGPPTQLLHSAFCLLTFAFREAAGKRQKAKGKRQKLFLGPPTQLLHSAFCLLTFSLHPPVERERINSCMAKSTRFNPCSQSKRPAIPSTSVL